jgi:hypothetical protein
MLKNILNNKVETIFFFSAKKVKRDFLYQSKEILQNKNIKLSKPSINIEKNIRKIRLLENILKSSTLIGTSEENFSYENLKEIANMDIPGLHFMGVISGNNYITKDRLNTNTVTSRDVLYTTFINLIKVPQTLSNSTIYTTGLVTNYLKSIK